MGLSRMNLLAAAVLLAAALACTAHPPGEPCGTVCVREEAKKTTTKTVYRCKVKTICLPYCGASCGSCDDGACGKPRQVRVLIKRFVKEEKCEVKCLPREVPACAAVIEGVTVQPKVGGK